MQFAVGFALTTIVSLAGLRLFPNFRSQETKAGTYRIASVATASSRLPLLGGPAILLSVGIGFLASAFLEGDTTILSVLYATVPFFLVGLVDDLKKSIRKKGLSERASLLLTTAAAAIAAVVYASTPASDSVFSMRIWVGTDMAGNILFAGWSFILFMVIVISTGISDGVDGLTPGLGLIAAIGIALVCTAKIIAPGPAWMVAGISAGVLLLNLPSTWTPQSPGKRRAKLYLGDSGALTLGALLTGAALTTGFDLLLPLITGVLVLEGLSSVVQAKIYVPLYRRSERLGGAQHKAIHHSEFPLPFVTTPFHHHLEFIGLDRLKLVGLMWLFASIGTAIAILAAREGTEQAATFYCAIGAVGFLCIWFGFSSLRPARLTVQHLDNQTFLTLKHGWKKRRFGLLPSFTARRHLLSGDLSKLKEFPIDQPLNPFSARRMFDEIIATTEGMEHSS